jgi:hypothetical protein
MLYVTSVADENDRSKGTHTNLPHWHLSNPLPLTKCGEIEFNCFPNGKMSSAGLSYFGNQENRVVYISVCSRTLKDFHSKQCFVGDVLVISVLVLVVVHSADAEIEILDTGLFYLYNEYPKEKLLFAEDFTQSSFPLRSSRKISFHID